MLRLKVRFLSMKIVNWIALDIERKMATESINFNCGCFCFYIRERVCMKQLAGIPRMSVLLSNPKHLV